MADYIFELIIDELDNRYLFIEKAGDKIFKPAIFQKFDECWGIQDSLYKRKIFDFWKDSFFPMLLQKYNISEKECMVRYQGPVEMHEFFNQEKYKSYFEAVGDPIKGVEESALWASLSDDLKKIFPLENESSFIEKYTDVIIPEIRDELEKKEKIKCGNDDALENKNNELARLNEDVSEIEGKISEKKSNKEKKEKSQFQKLETLYQQFSSEVNRLCTTKFNEKKYEELKKEVSKTFDIVSLRDSILKTISSEDKENLSSFFTLKTLSDCVGMSIDCAFVKGKEHGLLKKNKWNEYSFDSTKFINKSNEIINKAIEDKISELQSKINQQHEKELKSLKRDLNNKKREVEICEREIIKLKGENEKNDSEMKKLNESLVSQQNKVEALNAR